MGKALHFWRRTICLSAMAVMAGCANFYVDGAIKEIPAAQYVKPATTGPVQTFFEFQTKGVTNVQATALLQEKIYKQIEQSGLFSKVSSDAQPGSASLSVVLNNVPMSDDAFKKGFVTGLSFGLVGSQGADGYVLTLKYTPSSGGAPLVKSARHAIHTTLGAKGAVTGATKAASIEEAVTLMTKQVLSQALSDLASDPAFKP